VAKDLNKLAAKSSIKNLVADAEQGKLYRWVAMLTGSKNALKGLGYFLGGALLASLGFQSSIVVLLGLLLISLVAGMWLLDYQPGSNRRRFFQSLSTSPGVNRLSAARLFLFCSRDIWFVVALPVFLQAQLGWSPVQVGSLMAGWIIFYGAIQAMAPKITAGSTANGTTLFMWAALLSLLPCAIAVGLYTGIEPSRVLVTGLLVYAAAFAVNSSLHSYLILALAQRQSASLDVGFYYMANAGGRLLGTLLSGLVYQQYGLISCLLISSVLIVVSALLARGLQPQSV
jgi:hypothetical protein